MTAAGGRRGGDDNRRLAERRVLQLLHGRRAHFLEIHGHILRRGFHQSNLILSHFVLVCAALGRMPHALRLFHQVHNPNILLFNAMIKGYSLSTSAESLPLFSLMRGRGIYPDQYTFAPLLKSCSNLSDLALGRGVHAETVTAGFDSHGSVRVGLVELYAGAGQMDDARKMFDVMPERDDAIIWNLMIRGFCKGGDTESGYRLFREMGEKRSVFSWNTMLAGLAGDGRRDGEVLELLREMWEEGFEPDDATLVTVLPVSGRLGALDVGRWIHTCADRQGLLKDAIHVGNALVDMYCKCGDLTSAREMFDAMPKRNVVSWNSIILGLAFNGRGEDGAEMFGEMKRRGVVPNGATYVGVLACCTHAGLVERGREIFHAMVGEDGVEPELEHYGCMVDLFGRSGHVKEALELIRSMAMRPNAAIWGALLSACRTHGDLEVAEVAAEELIKLEPWNSGNYTLLSNILAERGRWDDAERVRMLMKERRVSRSPGQSLVEMSSS